jgi:hypothetical protein
MTLDTLNNQQVMTNSTTTFAVSTARSRKIEYKRNSQSNKPLSSENIMRKFFKGEISKEQARVQLEEIWKQNKSRSTTPESNVSVTPRNFNQRM